MDFAADALLLAHEHEARQHARATAVAASPPRRPRPLSWHMWLSSRVGAAEAALATVFVGGAALAASPRRTHASDAAEVLPELDAEKESPPIDLSLADAWGAVRRAASAAMASFDDVTCPLVDADEPVHGKPVGEGEDSLFVDAVGDPQLVEDTSCCPVATPDEGYVPQDGYHHEKRPRANRADSGLCHSCQQTAHHLEGVSAEHQCEKDKQYSDVTPSSSLGDGLSRRHKSIPSCSGEFPESCDDLLSTSASTTMQEESNSPLCLDKTAKANSTPLLRVAEPSKADRAVLAECIQTQLTEQQHRPIDDERTLSRLAALRADFNIMFEQNGGSECVVRVKQIGDDALACMRDSAPMDEKVMAELDDAKLILDDALCRLDAAVRSKVNARHPEYADAASAADAVIAETKENNSSCTQEDSAPGLITDGSRLLAVFATKVCASVLDCIETAKDQRTWSERVENLAKIATLGVSQLRTVSFKFADAISRVRGLSPDLEEAWPVEMHKLNETAIGHVLQCVALAIAVLQIEAAERAYACTADN